MNKWFPDQKVLAGGLGGVTAWGIMLLLTQFGINVPPGLEAAIPVMVALVTKYLVPAADQDVIRRLNDDIVAMAAASKSIPVTPASNASAAQNAPDKAA